MNDDNLLKMSELTPSQRRANASKAGKASAKARRERMAMRDEARFILGLLVDNGEDYTPEAVKSMAELNGKAITIQTAAMLAVANKAIKGDVKALEYLRDTAGEKPAEVLEITKPVEESVAEMDAYFNEQRQAESP